MAYYRPGMEPERIKKRMKTLFDKLNSAYPDKNIVGLYNDHKQWGKTVTELYRELGYSDGKSFLEAYGYKYGNKESVGGRPKSVDPEAIIEELQKKYPNGTPFKTANELFAGTEYESNLKTIANCSNDVFGMSLGKYLLSIGLIQSKEVPRAEKKKNYIICKVKPTASEKSIFYISTTKSICVGDNVEIPVGITDSPAFGLVEKVITCDEDSAPCDVEAAKTIIRKVGVCEYTAGLLSSILHVHAAIETDDLIGESNITVFKGTNPTTSEVEGKIPWAYCRGLSTEIMKVIDYLVEKDNQIYDYNDVILADFGIAELFVYTDDAKEVMLKYPDIKMVMFAENCASGTANLCYSKSGYPMITDSYTIGKCDLKSKSRWTMKHSPTSDFTDGNLEFTFKYSDDWDAMNYVYTDEYGTRKQLGK